VTVRSQRGIVEDNDPTGRIAAAFRGDVYECANLHQLCATRDKRKQPEHVRRAAIRADRGSWRKPYWASGAAARLLTPVNGKNGIATAICGGPNSIANISFEQRLSEAQRDIRAPPNTKEDFPITRNEL
jgi:hypothetical protein